MAAMPSAVIGRAIKGAGSTANAGLETGLVILGMLFPLMKASLLVVWAIDWILFHRKMG